ncbi:hypothetical protein [Rubripirellula reticaptiva]|nr:hypothetical protein [Rubripirellula reticaptiva]
MKSIFILAVVVLGTARPACATIQANDSVVIGGNTCGVFQLPMSELWYYPDEEPAGRKPIPKFEMRDTANSRGYRAKFAISRGRLFLNSIEGTIDGREVLNDEIIPKRFPIHDR